MSQLSDGQAEVVQGGVQSRPASGMRLPRLYLAGVVSVLPPACVLLEPPVSALLPAGTRSVSSTSFSCWFKAST